MFDSPGVPVPALRGVQGGRTMYVTLPRNRVLNNFFPREMEADTSRAQRPYDPNRADQIARYMADNRTDYVLGALTYALDVDGRFEEAEPGSGIGVLWIPLESRLRSTDGQHRRGAIKLAIDVLDELAEDNTALLIYVEPDIEKRRQMFSDMNWHQKPVSMSVNVGFDRRDPFARVTQELVATHPLLKGRIETERPSVGASSEYLYTQGAVYDALGRCVAGVGGRVRNREKWADRDDDLRTIGTQFFDLLVRARPELQALLDGKSLPSQIRSQSILGSSTTLRAIAGAFFLAQKEGLDAEEMTPGLARIDFSPRNSAWRKVGFVSPGKSTPNARLQEVRAASQAMAKEIIATAVGKAGASESSKEADEQ